MAAELNDTTAGNAIAVPTDSTDRTQIMEGFERSWRVRANGAFLWSEQAATDILAGDGGAILFINSSAAVRSGGPAHNSAYFEARGLARSLARQL